MKTVRYDKNAAVILSACLVVALAGCDEQLADDSQPTDQPIEQPTAQPPSPQTTEAGVYFSTNRSGNYEVVRLHNESLEYLTSDGTYDSWWPRQSPDGRTMLFYRSLVLDRPSTGGHNNNYMQSALWSLDLQTGLAVELIAKRANGWLAQGVVDWSPDGTQLVMAAIEAASNRWHLFTTAPDGSNPVRISLRSSLFLDPSWSADGSEIVYVAFPPDYQGVDLSRLEVYVADANGQNERRLTFDNLRDHDPYWSPDGSTIAFETAVEPGFFGIGKWAIRTVDAAGGDIITVLDDGNINTLPRWSQDGRRILFHRFEFGANHGFIGASMNADGSGYEAVSSGGAYDDTDLDWYRSFEQ